MSPTKSQILGTDPLQVLDLIDETAFATLGTQSETYEGYVERPGGSYWEGLTAEAALERALLDYRAISSARDIVDTAARVISSGDLGVDAGGWATPSRSSPTSNPMRV